MIHPKALTGACYGTQCHAAGLGGVPGLCGLQAAVAVTAGLGVGLPKIAEQRLAPAAGDLTQAQHGVQPVLLYAFVLLTALRVLHHLPQFDHILQAINHPGVGRCAIAACTAGLLVVGLDRLG